MACASATGVIGAMLLVASGIALAAERGADAQRASPEVAQLKVIVLELQRQMTEMKTRHAAQIDELRGEISKLKETAAAGRKRDELAALREAAQREIGEMMDEEAPGKPEETIYKLRGIGLQSLNPEISVTGDLVASFQHNREARKRSDFDFRGLGLHFEAYLDPYTRFKAAVPVSEDTAKLGEAYFTRYGVLPNVNLTLGKFRQQFGVVNRWHKHGLDQVDFPMPLRMIFGNGGLNQTGASLDWAMPHLWGCSQELTFQLTNGENDRMFGENDRNTPCALVHYKNYRDLSKDTYLEFGLSGLLGWNQDWEITEGETTRRQHDSRPAAVLGADLTVLWEPTERMRYRNWVWRSEAYLFHKDILAPDGSGADTLEGWGAYSYVQAKLSRTLELGLRADYFEPDTKGYADLGDLAPLAVTRSGARRWQIGPYVTWHASPFVRFRLEYNHADGDHMGSPEDMLFFQTIFAAGPHKHERY